MAPEDYVLSRFRPDEVVALVPVAEKAGDAINVFITEGGERAMNAYNRG